MQVLVFVYGMIVGTQQTNSKQKYLRLHNEWIRFRNKLTATLIIILNKSFWTKIIGKNDIYVSSDNMIFANITLLKVHIWKA